MAFDRELLESLADEGWLRIGRHSDADLWIYNYTEKTQYESHWTPETLACRGLILDADGGVVARPFAKFFNLGDPQVAELPDERYIVTEKIDGSLGILYWLDGEPCIATRGSFTSEQAIEGTRMVREQEIVPSLGTTPLFEIVYPGNRIVVDYGDRRELILLASIFNHNGLDGGWPLRWSGAVADHYGMVPVEQLVAEAGPNREGFVVAFEGGLRVKVKLAEYVRLHRIVTGINARAVWEALKNGDDLDALLDGVPDEIHTWIDETRAGLVNGYRTIEAGCRRVFDARPDGDRKTVAQFFIASGENTAVLFRMLDGKPYEEFIWKAIYPDDARPVESAA